MKIGEDRGDSFFERNVHAFEQASPKSSFFFSPLLLIFSFTLIQRGGSCVGACLSHGREEQGK